MTKAEISPDKVNLAENDEVKYGKSSKKSSSDKMRMEMKGDSKGKMAKNSSMTSTLFQKTGTIRQKNKEKTH